MRASKQTDERVAQYICLYSWLSEPQFNGWPWNWTQEVWVSIVSVRHVHIVLVAQLSILQNCFRNELTLLWWNIRFLCGLPLFCALLIARRAEWWRVHHSKRSIPPSELTHIPTETATRTTTDNDNQKRLLLDRTSFLREGNYRSSGRCQGWRNDST